MKETKLIYGTCVECGRERVPGQRITVEGEEVYQSSFHRKKGRNFGDRWCGRKRLKDIELRGTVARPLPASELNLKKLDDDQLQVLFERVEREMVRRAEGESS